MTTDVYCTETMERPRDRGTVDREEKGSVEEIRSKVAVLYAFERKCGERNLSVVQ
jgi:hypothetical protein